MIELIVKSLKSIQSDLDSIILDAVKQNEAEIIDLNIEQLENGLNNDSSQIAPAYTTTTIQIKRLKGQPTNRVTLKNEGDFHNSIFIAYGSDRFALGSTDIKTKKLKKKYGFKVLGLTDDSIQETIELIKPDLRDSIKKKLFE